MFGALIATAVSVMLTILIVRTFDRIVTLNRDRADHRPTVWTGPEQDRPPAGLLPFRRVTRRDVDDVINEAYAAYYARLRQRDTHTDGDDCQ